MSVLYGAFSFIIFIEVHTVPVDVVVAITAIAGVCDITRIKSAVAVLTSNQFVRSYSADITQYTRRKTFSYYFLPALQVNDSVSKTAMQALRI